MTDNNNNLIAALEDLSLYNVEERIENMKLFDPDYRSDDDERDRVRLTTKGIDIRALQAGQDVEFEVNNTDDKYNNWEDEEDNQIDYEKLLRYRKYEMISPEDDDENGNEGTSSNKTPFEALRIKMYDVTPEKDGGVLKRIITYGIGSVIPNKSRVRIHYNAYFELNDEPFDSTHLRNKTFEFKLGAFQVVHGLDVSVATMKLHEKSQFIFAPEYFMGKYGCEPRIPRDASVLFEIEVISFIAANELDDYEQSSEEQRQKLTLDQMMKICNCLRELGNDNYRRQNYKEASKKYRKAIYLLDNTSVNTDEDSVKWNSVMLKLYLNMSQVCVKLVKPKKTIFYCKLVLDMEPENVKALYRYGHSLRMLQDFDGSRKKLTKALKLAPANQDIINEIKKLNEMIEKYNILEKDMYRKMFSSNKNGTSDKADKVNDDDKTSRELIMKSLKQFKENDQSTIFKIQLEFYSKEVIEFTEKQAKLMNFEVRKITGNTPDTNVLQILKVV